MTGLQQFVTNFFETLDSAVVEVEYALIEVLIPDKYVTTFGKSELKLCFDYEVYLENTDYELVTFGSFILDKIIDLSFLSAKTSMRYVNVNNLDVYQPEEKIKKYIGLERNNIDILEDFSIINSFIKYSFKVRYVSDNTFEEFQDIIIDSRTGERSIQFEENCDTIFYDSKPEQYALPIEVPINFQLNLKKSIEILNEIAHSKAEKMMNDSEYEKEANRITLYYESLKNEAKKRSTRKNLAEEKIAEYENKIKIYEMEKNRQLNDVHEKYTVKPELLLQNIIIYAVPYKKYVYKVSENRATNEDKTCYYNMLFRCFE